MRGAPCLFTLLATACALASCAGEVPQTPGPSDGGAVDGSIRPDSGTAPDGARGPDARSGADAPAGGDARPAPDAAASAPDGATNAPDGATHAPDGATHGPDAATHPPDAPLPVPDAPLPVPDAPLPVPDAPLPDAAVQPPIGPLRVDPANPRYFTDGSGKVVYLTGSHTWGDFKDRAHVDPPPPFDFTAFLDFLVAHHHNFIRLWTWEQAHSFDDDPQNLLFFAPFPWPRTGPGLANDGKPRFDLSQLDQTYFDRMRARIVAAGGRGIYVSVMLFDGWDLANGYNSTDGGFPYGAGNNVNGVASDGPAAETLADATVTQIQEAYVAKVIDTVNDLDNVLYEIANETGTASVAWQYHMIDYVKQVESGKPKQHPVGMTSTYPGTDSDLFASGADWISPNGRLVAGDGRKVILNDTDHSYGWTDLKSDGPAAQRAWAWKTFTLGAAPLFMDPYLEVWAGRNQPNGSTPDPAWNPIRDALGRTRIYADKLDLERATPSGGLSSTGYCLADPGHQYLVYQPSSGGFMLTVVAGTYTFEWYNPSAGSVAGTGSITVGSEDHAFTPPFSGDAVLLLTR